MKNRRYKLMREQKKELNEDELDNIAGGITLQCIFIADNIGKATVREHLP